MCNDFHNILKKEMFAVPCVVCNGLNFLSTFQKIMSLVRCDSMITYVMIYFAGHVGTVIEIGRPGSKTSPDKTVVVQWDSGNKTNYRVGYQGAYDLRLFDNAPSGQWN